MADIPDTVLDELEEIRASGETNMYARKTVIRLLMDAAGPRYSEAAVWVIQNEDRYMEALNAMGARRSASG